MYPVTYFIPSIFTIPPPSGPSVYPSALDVRFGTVYGPTSNLTGALHVPTASQVLSGVLVDQSTGTVVLPTVAEVESGITFGPALSLTGTFAGLGGGPVTDSSVQADVTAAMISLGYTGPLAANLAVAVGPYPGYGAFADVEDGAAVIPNTDPYYNSTSLTNSRFLCLGPSAAAGSIATITECLGNGAFVLGPWSGATPVFGDGYYVLLPDETGAAPAESVRGSVVSATPTSVTISPGIGTVFNVTENAYASAVPRYLSFTSGANLALVVLVTGSSYGNSLLTLTFGATVGLVQAGFGDTVQID
jgi:hypothetical protein